MAKKNSKKIALLLCLTLVVVFVAALIVKLVPREKEFTVSADPYKNFEKFAYFADENGNKVSESNPYTYIARKEQTLTAVYEDNFGVTIQVQTSGNSTYESDTRTYTSKNWYDLAYVDVPLTYGMAVEFDLTCLSDYTTVLFGISSLDRIKNSGDYGWGTSYTKLFVPEYNLYYSLTTEYSVSLIQKTDSSLGGKTTYDGNAAGITRGAGNTTRMMIILDDEMKVYADNVLITSSNLPDWPIDKDSEYYLSLSGGNVTYSFTYFGSESALDVEYVSDGILTVDSFADKKITFLGDSITAGAGTTFETSAETERYSSVLCTALGATENNMGSSGTVLCTGHASRLSRLNDIESIPLDSDYVLVMLGTNDFDQASEGFAELGESGSEDTSTVYGAANALCKGLTERFEGLDTKIYLITPPIRKADPENTAECANGYTLRDFSKALMDTAKQYGIVCYDLNDSGVLTADDMENSLHPSADGHTKLAEALQAFLQRNFYYYKH